MKKFKDFLSESAINESSAPFYDGAAKIQAILSSEDVASFMEMQSPDIIEQKSALVYKVKGNGPAFKYKTLEVTLKKVSRGSENPRYQVLDVRKSMITP